MTLTMTTLEQLKELSQGKVVELPGWYDDEPFVARIKRPSIQIMCANGQIPNTLLGAASKLFTLGSKVLDEVSIIDITEIQLIVAKASLVEPTTETLEELGLELTDTQLAALFQHSMAGQKGLETFRPKPEHNKGTKPVKSLPGKAE